MLHASNLGVENTVIGMAHRGRLNILARLVQKPIVQILYEFRPHTDPDLEEYLGSGDVKYHVGASSRVKLANGEKRKKREQSSSPQIFAKGKTQRL